MSPSPNRITQKTIADKCGYSVNTVSRALRGDTGLPAETLAKIQTAADELGYIRNNLASTLRSGKSHIIAIIIDNILNPHCSAILSRMDAHLRKLGYFAMVLCSYADEELQQEMVNLAVSHSAEGILLFPHSHDNQTARLIAQNHIPYILVDREISDVYADIVRLDDYQCGYIAGTRLLQKGHRRFAYLAGPELNGSQPLRQQGFLDALAAGGISQESVRIFPSGKLWQAVADDTFLDVLSPIDYTAIFAFNDEIGYYAINCLKNAHYHIPEDISIIGVDYLHNTFSYIGDLSSITVPLDVDYAAIAVQTLLQRIEHPELPIQKQILPAKYFEDGTIGEPVMPAQEGLQAQMP